MDGVSAPRVVTGGPTCVGRQCLLRVRSDVWSRPMLALDPSMITFGKGVLLNKKAK
jgi:hypothetical protein